MAEWASGRRVQLTAEGRALLRARAEELDRVLLPAMRPMLVEEERDERVVADFERLTSELDELSRVLDTAGDIDEGSLGPQVDLGSRVTVDSAEHPRRTVRIVDPVEAFLDDERISSTSPLAQALIGHVVGDQCLVDAPAGRWTATIVAVH